MKHCEYIRDISGSKTAVLMIHGIVGTPAHFSDLIPMIPKDHTIHNILLDGHGKTVKDFGASSMKKWKEQVEAELDKLFKSHEKVIIVAHSMGTLFAIQEAIEHPDKIEKLFLLAVPLKPRVKISTYLAAFRVYRGKIKPYDKAALTMKNALGVEIERKFWKYITWIPRMLELLKECKRTCKVLPQLKVQTQAFQSNSDELVSLKSCKYLEDNQYVTNTILYDSGHYGYGEKDLKLLQKNLSEIFVDGR